MFPFLFPQGKVCIAEKARDRLLVLLWAYLQELGLNFLPCRRQDGELSLHWHRQVSGFNGWFLGHSAAHTHPHSSSSQRWPVGHHFPSPWPSHWHSPAGRELHQISAGAPLSLSLLNIWSSGSDLLDILLPKTSLCLSSWLDLARVLSGCRPPFLNNVVYLQ